MNTEEIQGLTLHAGLMIEFLTDLLLKGSRLYSCEGKTEYSTDTSRLRLTADAMAYADQVSGANAAGWTPPDWMKELAEARMSYSGYWEFETNYGWRYGAVHAERCDIDHPDAVNSEWMLHAHFIGSVETYRFSNEAEAIAAKDKLLGREL